MKRLALYAVLTCLGAGLPAAMAQQDLTREQVSAYVALTKADRARDRGETLAAQVAYEDALAKYTAIKERDPRWHPDVVGYRMNYCLQQLDGLKAPPPPPAPEPAPEESAPTEPAPEIPPPAPEADAAVVTAEVESLRAQVAELQAALVVTQALAQLEQERSGIMAERDQLRARVTELESAPDPTVELRATLDQRQGEITRLQAGLAEAEAGREAKALEVGQLELQLEAQLAVLRTAQTNGDQLREQLAAATTSAEQVVRERDQARAEREAALKDRNELAPQMREARQQMEEMQSAIKALKARETERSGESKKRMADLREEIARLKAGLPTPTEMEAALSDQVESMTRQLRTVREEASLREVRLQQLETENEALKKAP